jgi:hypothetical protein
VPFNFLSFANTKLNGCETQIRIEIIVAQSAKHLIKWLHVGISLGFQCSVNHWVLYHSHFGLYLILYLCSSNSFQFCAMKLGFWGLIHKALLEVACTPKLLFDGWQTIAFGMLRTRNYKECFVNQAPDVQNWAIFQSWHHIIILITCTRARYQRC